MRNSINALILFLLTLNAQAQRVIHDDLTVNTVSATSTTKGSKPCPEMTEAQRDAIASPANGSCVFNSTKKTLNVFDATSEKWRQVAGAGGDNKNLLTNGNFDDLAEGWTLSTTGTALASINPDTSAYRFPGQEQSGSLVCLGEASGGTCSFRQDVTTRRLQGKVSIYVLAQSGTVKVFSRVNGVRADELTVSNSLEWGLYEIPTVLGATSTGIEIEITTGPSQSNYVLGAQAFVGPQDVTGQVPMVTEWQSYTPVFEGFGSPTAVNFSYRRIGDSIEIIGRLTSGTPSAVSITVSLPNGMVTKLSSNKVLGRAERSAGAASYHKDYTVHAGNGSSKLYFGSAEQASTRDPLSAFTGSDAIGAGQTLLMRATVPIQGLSSTINTYTQQCQSDIECENNFEWNGSAAGAVSSDKYGVIVGSSVSGATFTYNFRSGTLTTEPVCLVTVNGSQNSVVATSSSVSFETRSPTGGVEARPHRVVCFKQGSDRKPRRQIVGSFKHHVTNSSDDLVRVESCRVNNNGSASINTGSGLCEPWVQSVSRTGVGSVTITARAGIFSSVPVCSGSVVAQNFGRMLEANPTSATTILTEVNAGNDALVDQGFLITCVGKR
jgi:hypothetical protein